MSEIRFYKGKHRVKVLNKNRGKWIVEALEDFRDKVGDEIIEVKSGTKRTVIPILLFKSKRLAPPIKEHVYELKMEKKLRHLIEEGKIEKKENT